jgi:Tol biopolymer transport system component
MALSGSWVKLGPVSLAAALLAVPVVMLLGLTPPSTAAQPGANGRIAFSSGRTGNGDIYVTSIDGQYVEQITRGFPETDTNPAWSPDGSRIAFQRLQDDNWDIYVVSEDGTNETRLTFHSAFDTYPAWSPDGSQIAFQSGRDGYGDIYVMDADGSDVRRLTDHGSWDGAPDWSPDGSKILFESGRDHVQTAEGWPQDIYTMRPNGTDVIRLTDIASGGFGPSWSPDGSRIAFSGVYIMNADGSSLEQLPGAIGSSPSWSPDGEWLTFEGRVEAKFSVFTIRLVDGSVSNVTSGSYDREPDWQPITAGNVNCRSGVTSVDALLILQFDARLVETLDCQEQGDVDGDEETNSEDASLVLQHSAGLINLLTKI